MRKVEFLPQIQDTRMVFDIRIDGVSLLARLKTFETQFEDGPAGAYACGFQPDSEWMSDNHITPFICPCGIADCWSLSCDVFNDGETISWKNWRHGNRSWDYSQFGTLVFDFAQYSQALSDARSQLWQWQQQSVTPNM